MAALLLWIGVALDVGVLAGLVARRRLRHAYTLPLLLAALTASAVTVGVCPACNTWDFWLAKEFVHAGLFLLLGLELSLRLFPRRSRGRRAALVWVGVVTAVMLVWLATAPSGPLMVQTLPRIMAAAACLYAGLTLVMARYVVPLGALHDALLYGFTLYLIVYVAAWGFTRDDTTVANLVSPLAFDVVMANLLRIAWQREERPPAPPALVRFLWSWR